MKNENSDLTCFATCKKDDLKCANDKCRAWFKSGKYRNCTIIASEEGPMTLQNIGDLFKLTRMRICQIEKNAISKIRDMIT